MAGHVGFALAWSDLPLTLIQQHGLERRALDRGGEREIQFFYRDPEPLLPVCLHGTLHLVRWGNRQRESKRLPRTGWREAFQEMAKRGDDALLADVPPTLSAWDEEEWQWQ